MVISFSTLLLLEFVETKIATEAGFKGRWSFKRDPWRGARLIVNDHFYARLLILHPVRV